MLVMATTATAEIVTGDANAAAIRHSLYRLLDIVLRTVNILSGIYKDLVYLVTNVDESPVCCV